MNGGLQSSFTVRKKKKVKEKSCLRNSIQPFLRRRGNFLENPPLGTAEGEENTREGMMCLEAHFTHITKKTFSH